MPIVVENLKKGFGSPRRDVLHDISLKIEDGEFVSISGRSGSGKTTLLYLLSTLDFPSEGSIQIEGRNSHSLSEEEVHQLRNQKIGFIFQFHYLLPELTAIENVLLPARKQRREKELAARALILLEQVGLKGKEGRLPSQLSGGEQQRVAIARALLLNPRYIFADEPTGNLDTVNAAMVMDILKEANRKERSTLVLVTHEPDFALMADRQIFLRDGRVVPSL